MIYLHTGIIVASIICSGATVKCQKAPNYYRRVRGNCISKTRPRILKVERCCVHKISTVVEHNDNTHDYKTNDRKNN